MFRPVVETLAPPSPAPPARSRSPVRGGLDDASAAADARKTPRLLTRNACVGARTVSADTAQSGRQAPASFGVGVSWHPDGAGAAAAADHELQDLHFYGGDDSHIRHAAGLALSAAGAAGTVGGCCHCDLPSLIAMGVRQSRPRAPLHSQSQESPAAGGAAACLGRRGTDNNHHNHHQHQLSGASAAPTAGSYRSAASAASGPQPGLSSPGLTQDQLRPDSLKIVKFKVGIDKRLTTIDERSPGVLKYKTPHFRASAVIEIPPLAAGTGIQVGWIQTCAHMQFFNTYGDHGFTSWEFPEILWGKYSMVSDADGKQYPWYGARQEVSTLRGPSPRQRVTVEMNDNFFPQVTWCVPAEGFDRRPRLTRIARSQKFFTFLSMRRLPESEMTGNPPEGAAASSAASAGAGGHRSSERSSIGTVIITPAAEIGAQEQEPEVHILRAVTWSMELVIAVDPERPLGQRARLVGPFEQEPPRLVEADAPLPLYALRPPNANRSQTLIWRPRRGEPRLVVAPLETTVDIGKYIIATRNMGRKLQALLPES